MATIATIPLEITVIQNYRTYSHVNFKVLDVNDGEGQGLVGVGAEMLAIDVLSPADAGIVVGLASLVLSQP